MDDERGGGMLPEDRVYAAEDIEPVDMEMEAENLMADLVTVTPHVIEVTPENAPQAALELLKRGAPAAAQTIVAIMRGHRRMAPHQIVKLEFDAAKEVLNRSIGPVVREPMEKPGKRDEGAEFREWMAELGLAEDGTLQDNPDQREDREKLPPEVPQEPGEPR